MKLLNDEEDLFLHDFSKQPSEETERDPSLEFSFGPTDHPDSPEAAPGRKRRGCAILWWLAVIAAAALGVAFYIRYYIPHTAESKARGYITLVEKRGIVFRTFEGEMVSETQLSDTARIYQRDLRFSIPDDSLGRLLQGYQTAGRPVVITTKKYYGTLPWRGATNTILTDISPL